MSEEDLKKEVERLRAENRALKARQRGELEIKVSQKGGVSIYGLGRFPVTLYKQQWLKILDRADEIRAFIVQHDSELSDKSRSGSS